MRGVRTEVVLGVRAKCSRCDYLRTFAEDLRGTYYRCPRCREGVIAVPFDAGSSEPSDEAPSVLAARLDDGPPERERDARGRLRPTDETPDGAFFGARASDGGRVEDPATTAEEVVDLDAIGAEEDAEEDEGGPDEPPGAAPLAPASSSGERGGARRPGRGRKKSVKVRRILVECALCNYHVAVPPELFGKTVHCPECRADLTFSESSLEPVKDEIMGRIALDVAERRVLNTNPVGAPIASPEILRRARARRLLVVALVVGALVLAAGVVAYRFVAKPSPRG